MKIKLILPETINVELNDNKLNAILYKLNEIGIQMSEQQVQIDAVTTQVTKIFDEVVALKAVVADLEAQVAAGGPVDLTALQEVVQSLDDLNPDVIV